MFLLSHLGAWSLAGADRMRRRHQDRRDDKLAAVAIGAARRATLLRCLRRLRRRELEVADVVYALGHAGCVVAESKRSKPVSNSTSYRKQKRERIWSRGPTCSGRRFRPAQRRSGCVRPASPGRTGRPPARLGRTAPPRRRRHRPTLAL